MSRCEIVILAVGYAAWILPFFLIKRTPNAPREMDRRARWGVLLQLLAFTLACSPLSYWTRVPGPGRVVISGVFFALAGALSWSATRALGKQWRIDAGLNVDHERVQSGVYSLIRNPIYTSMMCLLLGVGVMVAPWQLLAAAVVLMMVGMEIRVRIEERLLAKRFGPAFERYKKRVAAYVPFLRVGR